MNRKLESGVVRFAKDGEGNCPGYCLKDVRRKGNPAGQPAEGKKITSVYGRYNNIRMNVYETIRGKHLLIRSLVVLAVTMMGFAH